MSTALARIEERIDKSVTAAMSVNGGGIAFRNATEVMEFAKMMAVSGSAVPKHLRGEPGACLGIIDDAIRFGFSPYALARKSYFVNDNVAYEAQVLAAIVLSRAPLRERPDITYVGEGASRQCIVTFTFAGGETRTYQSPPISQIHPKNSPLWKSDPDQQLAYYSLRAAARRHCADVLLGIYDIEEMAAAKARDVTPQPSGLAARLQAAQPAGNGFSPDHVARELGDDAPPARVASPSARDTEADSDLTSPEPESASPSSDDAAGDAAGAQPDTESRADEASQHAADSAAGEAAPPVSPDPHGAASTDSLAVSGAGQGAEARAVDNPSDGPRLDLRSYVAALRRATKAESLPKFATAWFKANGGWPPASVDDHEAVKAINDAFKRKLEGNIDAKALEETLRELLPVAP